MTSLTVRAAAVLALGFGLALSAPVPVMAAGAGDAAGFSKDTGPVNRACDGHAKGSPAWRGCIGPAKSVMPDDELFYAGYWLAKQGRYADALTYLQQARVKDARVLTYIGFATRKLGAVDQALPLYAAALEKDPNYAVARAYLGEAYLARNEPGRAKAELAEIAARCGTTCAPYVDLSRHIEAYDATHG